MIGIYKITNPEGAVYIGQSKDIEKRFYAHKMNKYYPARSLISESYRIFGVENHIFEIIDECEKHELKQKERHYQDMFIESGVPTLNSWLSKTDDKPFKRTLAYLKLREDIKKHDNKNLVYDNRLKVLKSESGIDITALSFNSELCVKLDYNQALNLANNILVLLNKDLIIHDKRDILF